MKFTNNHPDEVILQELSKRIVQYRLNANKTQADLAQEAGVSLRTVNRLEHGSSVQIVSFMRILRALGLLENIDALVPQPVVSPIQQLKMHGKARKRASRKVIAPQHKTGWDWEDEI